MRGTLQQAIDYCTKADTHIAGPFQVGTRPEGQGARMDLKAVYNSIKAKKTDLEILEASEGAAAKFEKAIRFQRFVLMERESDRQLQGVRIITLYGHTGTGKTYAAINYIANSVDYYICEAPSCKNTKVFLYDV